MSYNDSTFTKGTDFCAQKREMQISELLFTDSLSGTEQGKSLPGTGNLPCLPITPDRKQYEKLQNRKAGAASRLSAVRKEIAVNRNI